MHCQIMRTVIAWYAGLLPSKRWYSLTDPRRDGTLSWRRYKVATWEIWTYDIKIRIPAFYHIATSATQMLTGHVKMLEHYSLSCKHTMQHTTIMQNVWYQLYFKQMAKDCMLWSKDQVWPIIRR